MKGWRGGIAEEHPRGRVFLTQVLQRCIWGREKLAEWGYEAGSLGEEQRRNSGFRSEAGVFGDCHGHSDQKQGNRS